jgi:hypothetical protein
MREAQGQASDQAIGFADSTWPLLVVRLPPVFKGVQVMEHLIDGFELVHARNGRFVVLVDCSAVVKFPGPSETKMLTDWMSDPLRVARERELTLGSAVVLTSGPMRAFVSAINWIRRPATPQVWLASVNEALGWCCDRLVAAGIALTPPIEAMRAEEQRRASSEAPSSR